MIQVFQPDVGRRELEAVERVFESKWLGRGEQTEAFEAAFAHHLGVPREEILSTTSCTEGLFQAIQAITLQPGDEVILPTISFVGAANAVCAAGGTPVFCEVDPATLNPRLCNIEEAVTPRTKAVLLLHYGGWALELEDIAAFCQANHLLLIEDAANSVASRVGARACGTLGDIGVWSFDAMKVLVTGEGGMVWVRDPTLRAAIRRNINLGLSNESGFSSSAATRWWEFDVAAFGRRATLNDLASAIGLVQLERLHGFVRRRRAIHAHYLERLAALEWMNIPIRTCSTAVSTYYFFWIQCEPVCRDRFARYLRDRGVYTTFRYYPLHRVAAYGASRALPAAELAADRTLLLPAHHGLSAADVDRVVELAHSFPPGDR